jgi:hypothetical protein
MPRNKDEEKLTAALRGLDPLEDVPADVSQRFNETLSRLRNEKESALVRPTKKFQFSSLSIAASFLVVLALGSVITLNSQNEGSLDTNPTNLTEQPNPGITSDQNLYSNNQSSSPKSLTDPIILLNSNSNYESIDLKMVKTLEIGSDWLSASSIPGRLKACLVNLQISEFVSAVDTGFFKGERIDAVWSPVGPSAWNVYVIDSNCEVLEKKYIEEK